MPKRFSEHLVHMFFQMLPFPELMVLVVCFTASPLLTEGFFLPLCMEQEIFTNQHSVKFPLLTFACYINFVWERGIDNCLRLRMLFISAM